MLHVEPPFIYDGLRLTTARLQGELPIDEPNPNRDPSQFVPEADHFAGCIIANQEPKTPDEEGLKDMVHMAAIHRSCGRG